MAFKSSDYRVAQGSKVKLKDWPTKIKAPYKSKEEYQQVLFDHSEKLSNLQALLSASASYALLAIFQAMDAGGKDGMIKHVMSGVNPQGCQVFSFKAPSSTDLAHDFLWRTSKCLPERGRIGIFNRSYYEEVLIARIHPEILQAQHIPEELFDKKTIWKDRFRSMVDLEQHLSRNGTQTVKFFLHISKSEQRDRFLSRIDDPKKNWKITPADIEERKYWDDYMTAYEEAISATSTAEAPWYIVPADDKLTARLIVSEILVEELTALNLTYPKTMKSRREELLAIRDKLAGTAKEASSGQNGKNGKNGKDDTAKTTDVKSDDVKNDGKNSGKKKK
ncbi:MAG: polyphosphate kinase 2 family protein [Cyanobacteria bacterium REEB67]|nr:polyphosphate kinase 2 family protein [Cyanobacteria bacterium REEB67]